MAIAHKLSQLSKMWKRVEPIVLSFLRVPDGQYTARISAMELTEAKKSGRLQVETTFEIVDGEYEGHSVKRFDGIEDETGMGYFKGFAEVIGFELPKEIEMLQEKMDKFVIKNSDLFDITLKTNEDYQNVYVDGVSDMTLANDENDEGKSEESEKLDDSEEEQEEEEEEEEGEEEEEEEKEEEEEEEEEKEEEEEEKEEEEAEEVQRPVRGKIITKSKQITKSQSNVAMKQKFVGIKKK